MEHFRAHDRAEEHPQERALWHLFRRHAARARLQEGHGQDLCEWQEGRPAGPPADRRPRARPEHRHAPSHQTRAPLRGRLPRRRQHRAHPRCMDAIQGRSDYRPHSGDRRGDRQGAGQSQVHHAAELGLSRTSNGACGPSPCRDVGQESSGDLGQRAARGNGAGLCRRAAAKRLVRSGRRLAVEGAHQSTAPLRPQARQIRRPARSPRISTPPRKGSPGRIRTSRWPSPARRPSATRRQSCSPAPSL